jgi:hypothetical protein
MNIEMKITHDNILRCIIFMEYAIKVVFDMAVKYGCSCVQIPPCALLIHVETKIPRDKITIFNFSH